MTIDIFEEFQHNARNEGANTAKKEKTKMRATIDQLEKEQYCKLASLVRKQDYEGIERHLKHGVKGLVNYVHPYDKIATVLSIAADINAENMVEFLLKMGADPNVKDMNGRIAATWACEFGNVESLKILVSNGTDVTLTDDHGNSILYYCIGSSERHVDCAKLCIETGAFVDTINKYGTPLIVAHCENACNNVDICVLLIEHGANPDVQDLRTRRTALMAAVGNGSADVVRAILMKGITNINETMVNTNSHVTHDAAKSGNIEIMQLLSAYGADFDQQTSYAYCRGLTPMHMAAANDNALCCLFAGQRGTNALLKNREGLTPALLAKKAGFKQTSKFCKQTQKFAPKKKKQKARKPPLWLLKLHDFLYMREDRILEEFQSHDPERENVVDISKFMQLVDQLKMPIPAEERDAFMQVVQKVSEDGDKVNYVKFIIGKAYIPKKLMMSRFEKKVKKLKPIKGKAKPNIPICVMPESHRPKEYVKAYVPLTDPLKFDRDHPPKNEFVDDSIWYMQKEEDEFITMTDAIMRADETTIDLALEGGMGVDERSRFFKTPLMSAIMSCNIKLVTKFVEAGANVNQRDNMLWTPLHLACHVGNLEIVDYLLKNGAKPTFVSINKALPLVRALEAKALEIVQALVPKKTSLEDADRKGATILELAAAWSDYYIFEYLKNQEKPDKQQKKQGAGKKDKKPKLPSFPIMIMPDPVLPIEPPDPPVRTEFLPPLNGSRMIETTSSQTYNDSIDENLFFEPRILWKRLKTTKELIEEKVQRRQVLGWDVDSAMYRTRVMKNVEEKAEKILESQKQKIRPILKMGNKKKGKKGKKKGK